MFDLKRKIIIFLISIDEKEIIFDKLKNYI